MLSREACAIKALIFLMACSYDVLFSTELHKKHNRRRYADGKLMISDRDVALLNEDGEKVAVEKLPKVPTLTVCSCRATSEPYSSAWCSCLQVNVDTHIHADWHARGHLSRRIRSDDRERAGASRGRRWRSAAAICSCTISARHVADVRPQWQKCGTYSIAPGSSAADQATRVERLSATSRTASVRSSPQARLAASAGRSSAKASVLSFARAATTYTVTQRHGSSPSSPVRCGDHHSLQRLASYCSTFSSGAEVTACSCAADEDVLQAFREAIASCCQGTSLR